MKAERKQLLNYDELAQLTLGGVGGVCDGIEGLVGWILDVQVQRPCVTPSPRLAVLRIARLHVGPRKI